MWVRDDAISRSLFVRRRLPDVQLPPLRLHVRDVRTCAYYDRLKLFGDDCHSGVWNRQRQVVYLFALSGWLNRVSHGSPQGIFPTIHLKLQLSWSNLRECKYAPTVNVLIGTGMQK